MLEKHHYKGQLRPFYDVVLKYWTSLDTKRTKNHKTCNDEQTYEKRQLRHTLCNRKRNCRDWRHLGSNRNINTKVSYNQWLLIISSRCSRILDSIFRIQTIRMVTKRMINVIITPANYYEEWLTCQWQVVIVLKKWWGTSKMKSALHQWKLTKLHSKGARTVSFTKITMFINHR